MEFFLIALSKRAGLALPSHNKSIPELTNHYEWRGHDSHLQIYRCRTGSVVMVVKHGRESILFTVVASCGRDTAWACAPTPMHFFSQGAQGHHRPAYPFNIMVQFMKSRIILITS